MAASSNRQVALRAIRVVRLKVAQTSVVTGGILNASCVTKWAT